MSLFNTMQTSVSGMAAQSNALGTIGDNIANSSTTGYKEANAQFETLLGNSGAGNYESGGVQTDIRYGVTAQGTLTTTTSATDLAISGNGYFVVSNSSGQGQYLTRAGSFVQSTSGNLVNAAGYELMGYAETANGPSSTLTTIALPTAGLPASASTTGTLTTNLPSTATAIAAANAPSATSTDPQYTDKTSLTVYDNLGTADNVDVYYTYTGKDKTTGDPTWQVSAYMQSGASASGGFPYTSGSLLGTASLNFDPTTGNLASSSQSYSTGTSSTTTGQMSFKIPNGNSAFTLDLSKTTQVASGFSTTAATANGNAYSALRSVKIATDGTLNAVYANGTTSALYKIPVGDVSSPNNLTSLSGNVYQTNSQTGIIQTYTAGEGGMGTIQADALEQSTVDLATELTNMIVAQRGYEANSKVLQSASNLLDNLIQIQTN